MKNLLKLYLWPLIKRFKALFITMIVLTTIGVTSIIAFNGVSRGIEENYNRYQSNSDAPSAFISTSTPFDFYSDGSREKEVENIEGVKTIERCLFVPCSTYLPSKEESKQTQLFTFDSRRDYYKPNIIKQSQLSKDLPNVWVEKGFAKLNHIKPDQTIQVGYAKQYIDVNVVGIVSYPDTVVYGATNSMSTENSNFGRLYIEKEELAPLLNNVCKKLESYISEELDIDLESKEIIERYIKYINDLDVLVAKQILRFSNRVTIYFDDDANQRETLNKVKQYLIDNGSTVLESYLFNESLSASLIKSSSAAMKSAGATISVFVFATVIIVLTMFLLQIIREMMRDIGVMQALGIKKEHIMILLSMFSLIISIIGTAFGVFFGHLLEFGLDKVVGNTFGVAVKAPPLRFGNSLMSLVMVIVASQFATFFASIRITKLMPVDALNDQASSKKVLPPSIDKKLQHASPGLRLTVNSVVTKPKRFVTSFLAIFASAIIIFTSIAALASFRSALNNTFDKYIRYDAQVVFASEPGAFEEELKDYNIIGAKDFEETRYAAPVLSFNGKEETIALQGLKIGSNKVNIPISKKETKDIPLEGVTINMITAKEFGIKEGDTVKLDNHDVRVAYISSLEAYNVSFCNIDKIDQYANTTVVSYLINGVDKEKLVSQVTNYHYDAMVTLTADQRNYFESRFQTLEMCCIVFIVFSIGLGVLIVSLMMQTSLMEQKRDLCIMRSVGFSMGQISAIWSTVTILQFIMSMIFAIPLSFLATFVFLKLVSTNTAMVLSYANMWHALITIGIVAAFLIVSHLACMRIVKKLNIAENTKNRE